MKPLLMPKAWRTVLATVLVALAAAAAFAQVTRGFRTVTADGARRIDLAASPRALPPIPMIDSDGRTFPLSGIDAGGAYPTVVTLLYTRCETICRASASGLAYLQQEIRARGLDDRVRLLTLSFDPQHDTPEVLAAYARRMKADAGMWRFATVAEGAQLPALLKLFDIVVLPDGLGGYSHNAALFLVDRKGRVARAYDIDKPDEVLADLLSGVPTD
jgi:protein SCO1/2